MSANPTPAPEQAHTQVYRIAEDGSEPSRVFIIKNDGTKAVHVAEVGCSAWSSIHTEKQQYAELIRDSLNATSGLNPSALPDVVKALEEIEAVPEVAFTRNQLEMAGRTIDRMQEIARAALASLKGASCG